MVFYLTLFLVFWAMLYTVARFFRFFRIVKEYTGQTTATIVRTHDHEPGDKREKPAVDVVMEYEIDGVRGSSQIVVPLEHAGEYEPGRTVDICYKVSPNGTVHIASAGSAPKKLMYGYLAAIVIEIVVYIVIWRIML